jgi:hypothetical protein
MMAHEVFSKVQQVGPAIVIRQQQKEQQLKLGSLMLKY